MVIRFDYRSGVTGVTAPFVSCIEQILCPESGFTVAWPMSVGGMKLEKDYVEKMLVALNNTDADYLRKQVVSWA